MNTPSKILGIGFTIVRNDNVLELHRYPYVMDIPYPDSALAETIALHMDEWDCVELEFESSAQIDQWIDVLREGLRAAQEKRPEYDSQSYYGTAAWDDPEYMWGGKPDAPSTSQSKTKTKSKSKSKTKSKTKSEDIDYDEYFVRHCRSNYYGGISIDDFRWGGYNSEMFEENVPDEEERAEIYSEYTTGVLHRHDYSGYVWSGMCIAYGLSEDTDMIEYDISRHNVAVLVAHLTCDEMEDRELSELSEYHEKWLPYDEYRKEILENWR